MISSLISPGDWIAWQHEGRVMIRAVLVVTDLGVVTTDALGVLTSRIVAHGKSAGDVERKMGCGA